MANPQNVKKRPANKVADKAQKKAKRKHAPGSDDDDATSDEQHGPPKRLSRGPGGASLDAHSDDEADVPRNRHVLPPKTAASRSSSSSSSVLSQSSYSASTSTAGPSASVAASPSGGTLASNLEPYTADMKRLMCRNMMRDTEGVMGDITPIMAMCLFGASDALRSAGRLREAASIAAHTRTAWRHLADPEGNGDEAFMTKVLPHEDTRERDRLQFTMTHAIMATLRVVQVFFISQV